MVVDCTSVPADGRTEIAIDIVFMRPATIPFKVFKATRQRHGQADSGQRRKILAGLNSILDNHIAAAVYSVGVLVGKTV